MMERSDVDWEGLERNRERPQGRPAIRQTWHDLVFLHARVPISVLQQLIPSGLTVESFDGSGWLGFVPFRMSQIRFPGTPAMPWLSSFYETNVRTYVTHPVHGPGVWFFSLDAARYLACWYARQFFKLPYFHAFMTSHIEEDARTYSGRRNPRQSLPSLGCEAAVLNDYLVSVDRQGPWHSAEERTFEYWLIERYRLYSSGADGKLYTAKVHHEPYIVAEANASQIQIDGLDAQFGELTFEHVLMAQTLNVLCFSPQVC